MRDSLPNGGAERSKAVGLKERAAVEAELDRVVMPVGTLSMLVGLSVKAVPMLATLVGAIARTAAAVAVSLAKVSMPLAARSVRPARLTIGNVQTAAVLIPSFGRMLAELVPIISRPKASDFRKSCPALAWLHVVKPKTGSAPVVLPSMANPPFSACASPLQTNFVSMAV